MKNIIKNLALSFIFFIAVSNQSFATQLPAPIVNLIKATFPKANIRFDGLVELSDGTKYIPVLPPQFANVDNPTIIIQTIPAKAPLSSKPNLVLFANNLSLLKLLKTQTDKYTLIMGSDIPLAVKFGILPQDLVVPENLIIPEELKIILGNLKIKTSDQLGQKTLTILPDNGKITTKPIITNNLSLKSLENKTFYLTNNHLSQVYAISAKTGKLIHTINVSSVPSSIAMTDDKKYILTTDISTGTISVIDTKLNKSVKKITVGNFPGSIVITKGTNRAYIANKLSSTISVIDLLNMVSLEEIKVEGCPTKITISEDNQSLYYVDDSTGKIYVVNLNNTKLMKPVTESINISKIEQFQNYLAILSRTENTLKLFDIKTNKFIKTIQVGEKPLDLKYLVAQNKIYVLTAGSNAIDVIDTSNYAIIKTIQLKGNAFPNKINVFDSGNKALITTADSYEMAIIDLKEDKVLDYFPITTPVSALLTKD